jgi:hypothetical protein
MAGRAALSNLRAGALIGSAIACFDAAQLVWVAHPRFWRGLPMTTTLTSPP